MTHEVKDVEQSIIDALFADAWLADKDNVKIISRYDGRFNVEDVGSVLTGLPGLFVAYVADRLTASTRGSTYVQTNQFGVVVAVSDQGGNFKAKQQALAIAERVHGVLHLNQLGLQGVYPGLERESRIPHVITRRLAVYELTFNISWVA